MHDAIVLSVFADLEEFLKRFRMLQRAEFKVPTRTVQTIPSDTIIDGI